VVIEKREPRALLRLESFDSTIMLYSVLVERFPMVKLCEVTSALSDAARVVEAFASTELPVA
jgi:hypothetical protein